MTEQLRPCIVGGRRAKFHKWVTLAFDINYVGTLFGIVEYENGRVECIKSESIRFIDGGGFDAVKWPNSAEIGGNNAE